MTKWHRGDCDCKDCERMRRDRNQRLRFWCGSVFLGCLILGMLGTAIYLFFAALCAALEGCN